MSNGIVKWIREHYNTITGSIAFYPVIIALLFLLLSIVMLQVDLSWEGQQLKGSLSWMRLRDPDTARVIVSTITAGLISLTVFSFSMVMIVLNQAAGQLSNRILENLIGNRTQQLVLGMYIGTIVYALFLLSSIRDIDTGTSIPALSIFLLILLTVIDIFVFIYFLHFITQSVKYGTIINDIEKQTRAALEKAADRSEGTKTWEPAGTAQQVFTPVSGYFQHVNLPALLRRAKELDLQLEIGHYKGSFVLEGTPFLTLYRHKPLPREQVDALFLDIDFYNGQPVDVNSFYGFRHLAEVAIKALSPGINDPSTAVLSLQALSKLLACRLCHQPAEVHADEAGVPRVRLKEYSFGDLLHHCIRPVWHYGKSDPYVQETLAGLLQQLVYLDQEGREAATLGPLLAEVKEEQRAPAAKG